MATLASKFPQTRGADVKGKGKAAAPTKAALADAEAADEKIEATLRAFDFTSKYGPCTGITRLQRWERAKELGLNPPEEIRDLLVGDAGKGHTECVWYGRI